MTETMQHIEFQAPMRDEHEFLTRVHTGFNRRPHLNSVTDHRFRLAMRKPGDRWS